MTPEDVPAGPLCVDTDAFSFVYLKRGRDEDFRRLLDGHLLAVSFATVGELRAMTFKARWGEAKRGELDRILRENYVVMTATDSVVEQYAHLHARFTGRLKGGGENDMWTAACALAQPEPLPVVTNNLSDFKTMAGEFPLTLIHPDL